MLSSSTHKGTVHFCLHNVRIACEPRTRFDRSSRYARPASACHSPKNAPSPAEVSRDVYRSKGRLWIPVTGRSVFGGQVLAQSLLACCRSVGEGFFPHSLHAYFIAAASDPGTPLELRVERVRDGRSYTVRSCRVFQAGELVYLCFVSFSVAVTGTVYHAVAMPAGAPPPEALTSTVERWRAAARNPLLSPGLQDLAELHHAADRRQAIEMRHLRPILSVEPAYSPPQQALWIRAATPGVPPDLVRDADGASCSWERPVRASSLDASLSSESRFVHASLLAYASDFSLLATALLPWGHPNFETGMMASLDHSIWFHAPVCLDDYVLFCQEVSAPVACGRLRRKWFACVFVRPRALCNLCRHSFVLQAPVMANDRALATGRFFSRDGTLLASVAQEGVIRWQAGAEKRLRPPLRLAFRASPLEPLDTRSSPASVKVPAEEPKAAATPRL